MLKDKALVFYFLAFWSVLIQVQTVFSATPSLAKPKPVVIAELGSIQKVSANNVADATDLLYDASAHLHHSWNESLLAEVGRVLNLSMRFDLSGDTMGIVAPFHLFLLSTKKDQFIEAMLPYLDERNREFFKKCVNDMLHVHRHGNG